MTGYLAGALLLSLICGVAGAGLFLVWPRRLTAEEWVVHRRLMSVEVEPSIGLASGQPLGSALDSLTGVFRRLLPTNRDLQLLALIEGKEVAGSPAGQLAGLAVIGAVLGGVLALAFAISSGSVWTAALALPVGGGLAIGLPLLQVTSWRLRARRARASIQHHLPRVLTGARVLLEAGAVTPHGALVAAVATYVDPAAELMREALRLREVRRLELEAALDEVAELYAIDDLHRLADAFRVGHRFGTGMSSLLADFCQHARGGWHSRYRERITRAPVLMTVPALLFFVLPLLVLVMFLVFTPLLGTLGRL